MNTIDDITGVVVCSNTKELLKTAFESVRKFHPTLNIIIIDGSLVSDPCYSYVRSLASEITTIKVCGYNIGHGRGMDVGIQMVKTRFALIFDSDIVMLKSPVMEMLAMMEPDTYGVGGFDYVDTRGFGKNNHSLDWRMAATKYLHPYFQLINVDIYKRYPPYVHHGSPCIHPMNAIKRQGLSERILKEFPGASIYGNEFIQHPTDGTRAERRSRGLPEIEGGWDRTIKRKML
jgi:GT2 family glycosyltransferase